MKRKIIEVGSEGDRLLREKSVEVDEFGDELHELLDDLWELLGNQLGLTGPQVGYGKRVFVLNGKLFRGGKDLEVINPEIVLKGGMVMGVEVCLSLPDREWLVKRRSKLVMEWSDRFGRRRRMKAKGLLSRVIQHERDHLFGVMVDEVGRELVKDEEEGDGE